MNISCKVEGQPARRAWDAGGEGVRRVDLAGASVPGRGGGGTNGRVILWKRIYLARRKTERICKKNREGKGRFVKNPIPEKKVGERVKETCWNISYEWKDKGKREKDLLEFLL
jgi:hypothetical protein